MEKRIVLEVRGKDQIVIVYDDGGESRPLTPAQAWTALERELGLVGDSP